MIALFDRYENYGPDLLKNSSFNANLNHWQIDGPKESVNVIQDGIINITLASKGNDVMISQHVQDPSNLKRIRLTATIRSEKIEPGKKPWHCARLILNRSISEKVILEPCSVINLKGTTGWCTFDKVFAIPNITKKVIVGIKLNNCTGTCLVKSISMYRVNENYWYQYVKWVSIILWCLFVFYIFYSHISKGRNSIYFLCSFSFSLVVLIMCIMIPGEVRTKWINNFKKQDSYEEVLKGKSLAILIDNEFYRISSTNLNSGTYISVNSNIKRENGICWSIKTGNEMPIAKIGHFIVFGLIGFFVSLYRHNEIFYTSIDIFMLAIATEGMQIFIDGRNPCVNDVLIDFGGGFLAIFFMCIFKNIMVFKNDKN